MQIKRPNCDICIHSEVCFQKSMAGSIVDEIGKIKHLGNKDYISLLSCFSLQLNCHHFKKDIEINKERMP